MAKSPFATLISLITLSVAASQAATIVNLDPASARFDSAIHNDDPVAGFPAGDPGGQNANGLTFNVTFSPAAGDLDSGTAAVSLLEIGGDANGSGLYLFGGELHFISKMNGAAGNLPSFPDLDWTSGNNMIGARSSFGPLTAGTEYSVAVVFDPITNGTLEIGVLDGGTISTDLFSLQNIGTKANWSGDDSASAFRGLSSGLNVANYGGANTNAANAFSEQAMNGNAFEGSQGQALYWSLNGTIIPEPSGLVLVGVGALLLFGRRWRS